MIAWLLPLVMNSPLGCRNGVVVLSCLLALQMATLNR
jgi:hypothetical protein